MYLENIHTRKSNLVSLLFCKQHIQRICFRILSTRLLLNSEAYYYYYCYYCNICLWERKVLFVLDVRGWEGGGETEERVDANRKTVECFDH
jgi:hypothetical protein